jgi:hypothetical protein
MDPFTIGAFLLSAGSSIAGGLLGSSAAKAQGKAAMQAFKVEKQASATRNRLIALQGSTALKAGEIDWSAGKLDFKASLVDGKAAGLTAASELYNSLADTENAARALEAQSWEKGYNARISRQMAKNALDVGNAEASDYRLRGQLAVESHRALQAGSGFTAQGSPMLAEDALFGEVELGATRLRHAGEVQAARAEQEAELLEYSGKLDDQSAKIAREVGKINAGYIKEAGKIRLDAAFLSGDRALISMESGQLTANAGYAASLWQTQANKQALQASKIQAQASKTAANIQATSSIVSGIGNAAGTLATSGIFG